MGKEKKRGKSKLIFLLSALLLINFLFIINASEVINMRDWLKVEIVSPIESNGGIPVNIQDQTSPAFDTYFAKALGGSITFLQANSTFDTYTINLTSTTNYSIGDYVGIAEVDKSYFGEVLAVNGTIITLDTPLDSSYTTNAIVFSSTRDLNVDGSNNRQIYSITIGAGSEISVDVTRIMIVITCTEAPELETFCDLPALTKGVVLRRVDGVSQNYWNVKNNGDFSNLAFDMNVLSDKKFTTNGLVVRYTFAGQDKHGVAVRLNPGDALELIVQDDLSSLDSFRIIAEGHFVTD